MLTSQESKSISSLKVIFCFLIILLHTHYQMPHVSTASDTGSFSFEMQKFLRDYLSTFLCGVAIPGFAIISGYLFFATAEFSREKYIKKMKNRIFSLLIPYVTWNLIVFGGDVVLALLGKNNLVVNTEWNFLNILNIFWSIKENGAGTCPYNGPLWYIRDLFIICLFTPIIYPLLKTRGVNLIFIILLVVALFVKLPHIYYHEQLFSTYFCIGAFCAVNQIRLFSGNKCLTNIILLVFVVGANVFYFSNYLGITNFPVVFLKQTLFLCALFVLPSFGLRFLQNEKLAKLAAGTFFIYCMHNSFLAMLGPVIQGHSSIVYLAYYFVLPVLDFVFGYAAYLGCRKLNNPIMNLLLLGKKEAKGR